MIRMVERSIETSARKSHDSANPTAHVRRQRSTLAYRLFHSAVRLVHHNVLIYAR